MRRLVVLLVVRALLAASVIGAFGCASCVQPGGPDAGVDGGVEGEGEGVAAEGEGEGTAGEGEGEVLPTCDDSTPGFGDACSQSGNLPLCGTFVCNPITAELVCADPGANACGVCGDLDDSEGVPNAPCGDFGCGIATCNPTGTATECVGDHPRNACGGCLDLTPDGALPGDVCSGCGSGERVCSTDLEELLCFRGREVNNRCGGCGRCIVAHAVMDDRFSGGFIRAGTTAIIEDVGGTTQPVLQLVFDPLVGGPGLDGLPTAHVYLSAGPDPTRTLATDLDPPFASALNDLLSDPHRSYVIPRTVSLDDFTHVVIFEDSGLLYSIVSVGTIVPGPPPP